MDNSETRKPKTSDLERERVFYLKLGHSRPLTGTGEDPEPPGSTLNERTQIWTGTLFEWKMKKKKKPTETPRLRMIETFGDWVSRPDQDMEKTRTK